MSKKKWLKKTSAIVLLICMVTGVLQYIPHISEAAVSSVDEQLQALGYTRVTPQTFGLENGLYEEGTMTYPTVEYGTPYTNGLDMTYLDADISFDATTSNTGLRFAGTGDTGILISGYALSTGGYQLQITDPSDRAASDTTLFTMEELGIRSVEETFNIKFALDIGTISGTSANVTYSMWINDVRVAKAKTMNIATIGNNLGVHVATGNSVRLGKLAVDEMLASLGYTKVTPQTFGLEEELYNSKTMTYPTVEYGAPYTAGLDMTYLDVDISFDATTSNTGIRFAGNGDTGILISGYALSAGGYQLQITDPSDRAASDTTVFTMEELGIDTVEKTFNIKFALDIGERSGTSADVTYSMWINDVRVAKAKTMSIATIGNNLGVHVATGNYITLGALSMDEILTALGYSKVTPQTFGLEEGLYNSKTMTYPTVEYGAPYVNGLDMTYLDVDISFDATTSNTGLRFAGNGDTGILISGYALSAGGYQLQITDPSDRAASDTTVFTMEELGIDTVEKTFNIKFALDIGERSGTSADVTYSMWINDVRVAKTKTMNIAALGNNLGVHVANDNYIAIGAMSMDEKLIASGYTRITPKTFGLRDGLYREDTMPNATVEYGTPYAKGLNMTYLDVDISFDATTSNTGLRFAGTGDTGILISGYSGSNGYQLQITDPEDRATSDTTIFTMEELGIESVEETFNIKFALDIGERSGTSANVTYSMWINDVRVAKAQTMNIKTIGNNLGVHVASGNSILLISPNLTPEQYGYERVTLADFGLENGTYYTDVVPSDHYSGTYDGSLNKKYLDVDLSFSVNSSNTCIRYASANGWTGISIHGYAGGLQLTGASGEGNKQFTYADLELDASKGLKETFNLKLATTIGNVYTQAGNEVCDITCVVWINDKEVGTHTFKAMKHTGNKAGIYANTGNVSIGSLTEKTLIPVSYDLAEGGYLVTGTTVRVWKNGVLQENVASGSVLNTVGTYTVQRIDNTVKSTQTVCLYKLGDVNCDGSFNVSSDLAALQNLLNGKTNKYKAITAADFAADLDNDNSVGTTDLVLMQGINSGSKSLASVKERYHVPAVSYEYLGGDEVMPIFGFYGPYANETVNFITDDIFRLIKDSGINMMVYTPRVIDPQIGNTSVLDAMEMAQKYGLGYYADDIRLNTEIVWENGAEVARPGAAPLSNTALADYLTAYSHYENYLGLHLLDEPCPNQVPSDWIRRVDNVDGVSQLLNGFANQHGFINANSNYYRGPNVDFSITSQYEAYLTDIVEDCAVPMLCYDYYPFENYTLPTSQYFEQLVSIRRVADANDIPFWAYVQAGGNHDDGATNPSKLPSNAEVYWNVNTLLAFGAKGIGWFTALQPDMMVPDASVSDRFDRLGLIGQDGTKTNYYDAVQRINHHIASIDEVLMKAKSTGIMAVHDAASDVGGSISLTTSTDMLGSIATSRYSGALVGCFDYRDTEAFYVVNYDVENAQTVTLNFKGNYDYRLIKDGATSHHSGAAATMNIPAGEAVLIVLEG